jgi:hypothetical protein
MAISLVQTAALGSTGSGLSQQTSAFGANPTVGNYLIAWAWGWNGSNHSTPTFTDTAGNAWAIPAGGLQEIAADLWLAVAYAKVTATGATFKVTCAEGTAGNFGSIMVVASEFSGIPATSPSDGAAVGATGTTGVPAPGSLTLTSGSLVVALFATDQTTYVTYGYSTPAGFTRAAFQNDGTNFQVGEAIYAIDPSSPSNPSWATGTVKWAAAQFALLATGGGGGGGGGDSGSSAGTGMQRPVAAGWV